MPAGRYYSVPAGIPELSSKEKHGHHTYIYLQQILYAMRCPDHVETHRMHISQLSAICSQVLFSLHVGMVCHRYGWRSCSTYPVCVHHSSILPSSVSIASHVQWTSPPQLFCILPKIRECQESKQRTKDNPQTRGLSWEALVLLRCLQ